MTLFLADWLIAALSLALDGVAVLTAGLCLWALWQVLLAILEPSAGTAQ